ncbi:MAG: rRNA pseudouridine synthase [Bacteroidetes bacterium]|nr:rRNA pseudouridine synthase [Bacteroidota bacterium]
MEQVEKQSQDVLPEVVRLNRFLAMAGIASRRAAEEFILNGEVKLNGAVVTELGTKVHVNKDAVSVRGKTVSLSQHLVYILLHKPKDYITTASDEKGRRTVLDLVNVPQRIFPVGRLDRNTTGALLLTNDGMLANKLMHPSSNVIKSYHVSLSSSLEMAHAEKLARGVFLEDGKTAPAEIELIPGTKNKEVVVHIHEGKNRQVRRMFESFGYEIVKLHRAAYAGLTLRNVGRGGWRYLTPKEIRNLKEMVLPEKLTERK